MTHPWPNSQDYNEAVQNPGFSFSDPDLRAAEAVTDQMGIPRPCSGNFADVYQLRSSDSRSWAVKCFTKRVESRRERYAAISAHLRQAGLPFTVGFEFLEQGIRIQGEWYPVLKMDWVEGHTLANFVRDNLNRPKLLKALLKIWLKVEPRLHDARMAHGDLQHGNVMLIPGRTADKLSLKLIDYDGLWVPALSEQPSGELGHPSYQHPERLKHGVYSADVDRFPHLVIAAALRCSAHERGAELWKKYDTGENLLFLQSDFERPEKSDLLRELWSSGDPQLQSWTGHLVLAAASNLQVTPRLVRLVDDRRIANLSADGEAEAERLLGLGIEDVDLGLRDDDPLLPDASPAFRAVSRADEFRDRTAPEKHSSEVPDWLQTASAPEIEIERGGPSPEPSVDASAEEEIPDWIGHDAAQEKRDEADEHERPRDAALRRLASGFRLGRTALRFFVNPRMWIACACVLFFVPLVVPWQAPPAGISPPTIRPGENPVRHAPVETPVSVVASAPLTEGTLTGEERDDNCLQMKLVWCPSGSFTMGSPATEPGRGNDEDQVEVIFTQGFWLGKYEITQSEWRGVMGTEPWRQQRSVKDGDSFPATCVNWNDAMAFCGKLTTSERESGRLPDDWEYRLPSEAQWEYACRAGTTTAYSFDDSVAELDEYAWFEGNVRRAQEQYAHGVGRKRPNGWGLHDLHGNVQEWCLDSYEPQLSGGIDPVTESSDLTRTVRGGSWWLPHAKNSRSASRFGLSRFDSNSNTGFRILCCPIEATEPGVAIAKESSSPLPAPFARSGTRAGELQTPNSIQIQLIWCPPGRFSMGSPATEIGRSNDEDLVGVNLTRGFWLGKYEVTQSQWEAVMQTTPWMGQHRAREDADCPATLVSWEDAVEFCGKLTAAEHASGQLPADWQYTLPTEAQWEYACRSGTTTRFSFGDDESDFQDYGWFDANALSEPRYPLPIGRKRSNAWGLHDIHGNVWEWCRDSELAVETTSESRTEDKTRPFRGGSWSDTAEFGRSAKRLRATPQSLTLNLGFRVAAVPVEIAKSSPEKTVSPTPTVTSTPVVSPASLKAGTRAGEEWSGNSLKLILAWCPPGSFTMGSQIGEPGRNSDESRVSVTMTQGFWLGKYEVTQSEWKVVMKTEPWEFEFNVESHPDCPATSVRWDDAEKFCAALMEQERAAGNLPVEWEYRLPTEAQWEYACRAGTTTSYSFGADASQLGRYAWFKDSTRSAGVRHANRVGKKIPNPWGLYDMHGNVWEWCRDEYSRRLPGGADPVLKGRNRFDTRVFRGGGWRNTAGVCRSAFRGKASYKEDDDLGFRVAAVRVNAAE